MNNRYNELNLKGINPFTQATRFLINSDAIIGNLECMSASNEGENILKKPRLKTKTETLNLLKKIPVSIVTLAHNHVYDNLSDGFYKTIQVLNKNNIEYLGAGIDNYRASIPLFKEINGITFCFLNYVTYDTNPKLPEKTDVIPNFFKIDQAINEIKRVKEFVDFVIVLLHWGGKVENGYFPDWSQPKVARQLIDNGSDLIIGHHSHTIQPFEEYKGKFIFYSLGNFCFDDLIFEDKLYNKISSRNKEALLVNISFNKEKYNLELETLKNEKNILYSNKWVLFKLKFRNSIFKVIKKVYFFWWIYYFSLKTINPIHFFIFREKDTFSNKIIRVLKYLLPSVSKNSI